MKVLGSQVDHEAMAVEVDVDALHVATDRVTRLEQDDIPRTIEQPRQRDPGHPCSDDGDRPPARRCGGVMRGWISLLLRRHCVVKSASAADCNRPKSERLPHVGDDWGDVFVRDQWERQPADDIDEEEEGLVML